MAQTRARGEPYDSTRDFDSQGDFLRDLAWLCHRRRCGRTIVWVHPSRQLHTGILLYHCQTCDHIVTWDRLVFRSVALLWVGTSISCTPPETPYAAAKRVMRFEECLPNPHFARLLRSWIWKFGPGRRKDFHIMGAFHEQGRGPPAVKKWPFSKATFLMIFPLKWHP